MEMEKQTVATTTTLLYEAVIKGDLPSYLNLLTEDPLIIDRCVIENSSKGFHQSPLHVAVHMGHLEMVKNLLNNCPSMCLAHDQDGRNPIHVAAIKGNVNVIEVLHKANAHAAQERTNDGQSVLHLSIKHNKLEAFKILLKLTNDDGDQLLNSEDNNGNTVLHLAVTSKNLEMVEYLLAQPKMKKNSVNKNDMTAVDIHMEQKKNKCADKRIEKALKQAKAKTAKYVLNQKANSTWYEEQRTALMVVASLIATMAFQVGINPPGGVWQDDDPPQDGAPNASPPNAATDHSAGYAIWSYGKHDDFQYSGFNAILVCNTLALLSSLSVILLLISGFRCKRYFISILRITLWITVTTTTLTYCFAVISLAHNFTPTFLAVFVGCVIGWLGLIFIIVLGNVVRVIPRLLDWQRKESIKEFGNKWLPRWSAHHNAATITDNRHNAKCESP